jgi:hypothetical protein
VRIFWGQLCGGHQGYYIKGIYSGESVVGFDELLEWDNFRKIFGETSIHVHAHEYFSGYGHAHFRKVSIGHSFRELEELVSPGLKFETRYERIKNKSVQRRNQLVSKIDLLKEKGAELARKPLCELIKDAGVDIGDIALKHGIGDSRLLNYLIKNGYLDESYHLYISIFHEGRMSRNDWSFIQAIRDFRSLDPSTQIDTPKEVVAEMREEDFGAEHVLNVTLMDYLLATQPVNDVKLKSAMALISKQFAEAEEFFSAYWISGGAVDKFTQVLAENWPKYAVAAVNNDQAVRHIARVIAYVPSEHVAKNMNISSGLADYLSKNALAIFSENLKFLNGYEALKLMSVKISDIRELEALSDLLSYVYEHRLYSLSIENVNFLLSKFPGDDESQGKEFIDCSLANYTAIKKRGSQPLIKYIVDNVDYYLDSVALALEGNVGESESSILEVINNPEVSPDLATLFALKQSHVFGSFEGMPDWMWGEMLFNGRLAINWHNVLTYFSHEGSDHDRLVEYFDDDNVATVLSRSKIHIPVDDDTTLSLCWFVISNTSIAINSFAKLCLSIPYHYKGFPSDLPTERRMILISYRIVRLNEESFKSTSDSIELRAELLKGSFDLYLKGAKSYPLDVGVKVKLLSILDADQKMFIVKDIALEEVQSHAVVLREVSRFLSSPGLPTNGFNKEIVAYCLANAVEYEVDVGILINFINDLTDQQITEALRSASEPYCNFVKANARQKIERTERNLEFVRALDRRDIISSLTDDGVSIRVNAYRKGLLGLF